MVYFDRDKYYNKKILNLYDYLDKNDIELLKRLNIEIEEYICSHYQYDIIKQKIFEYYLDEEESLEGQKEIKKYLKSLDDVNVTQEEYDKLIDKIEEIDKALFGC